MQKITSVDELIEKTDSQNSPLEFFILLGSGIRSSKSICKVDDTHYSVIHEIDDTEDILTVAELKNSNITNIPLAIAKNALFLY